MANLTFVWPFGYQDFATAASAGAWSLNDSVVFDHTFATAAVPWVDHDWLAVLGYQMPAGAPPAGPALFLRALMGMGL